MRVFYKNEFIKELETVKEVNDFIVEHGCENEPVKVYYTTNLLGVASSIEEANELVKNHQKANLAFYKPMIEESKALIAEVEKARHIHHSTDNYENREQYDEYFKKKYPDIVARIENLGRRFYKDKFIEVYAHDASGENVGFHVKLEPWQIYNDDPADKTTRHECLGGFGLKCVTKFAHAWVFEYLIGDVMVQPDKLKDDAGIKIWGARSIVEYTDMEAVPEEVRKEIWEFMDHCDIVGDGRAYIGLTYNGDKLAGVISVAYATTKTEANSGYTLMNVTVDQNYEHQGIATCLLVHALDFIGDKEDLDLFIMNKDSHERAIRLFKRLGFWTKREVDLMSPVMVYMERPAGSWELWRVIHDYSQS